MADQGFKRKLSAILSADVEGYSRLMGEDEEATIRTLTTYRELMSTLIHKHRGRVVDTPGDNLLAEFGSVVDSVRCAVEIQEELRMRNAELPENRRMVFRIGINLGDVVEEEERIYGDGVNIAARVEGLAEGGGICISGTVYDSIKNKLTLSYESIGEHTVKNIKEPVRVYRMRVGPEVETQQESGPKRWTRPALAAVIAIILIVGGVMIWNYYFRLPSVEAADPEKMAHPLPEKPSIAVLPFDNLSGDPEQEYIVDGITENITMALSRIPELFVIARNSTFTYKGKPTKVKQVAEELGVRYVLEGSVQKSGERFRITGQLIDAIKGHHVWAESYDRELKDIFVLQDEITIKIISAIDKKLLKGGELTVHNSTSDTKNLQAYLKILEARRHLELATPGDIALARKLSEEAISLDPEYPPPYNVIAWSHMMDVRLGKSKSPRDSINKAFELAQKLISMDNSNPGAHSMMGNVYLIKREYEKAIAEFEKAVALDPNWAQGFMWLAESLTTTGRPQEAIPLLKKSMRLSPLSQRHAGMCLWRLGRAYYANGQYEQAIPELKKAIEIRPHIYAIHLDLVATYIYFGREEEARATAAEVMRINPKFSLELWAKRIVVYNDQSLQDRFIGSLRKAGLK